MISSPPPAIVVAITPVWEASGAVHPAKYLTERVLRWCLAASAARGWTPAQEAIWSERIGAGNFAGNIFRAANAIGKGAEAVEIIKDALAALLL